MNAGGNSNRPKVGTLP